MNKDNEILAYDNALLLKERGIKIANVVLFIFFMLYIIANLYLKYLSPGDRITDHRAPILLPLILFVLLNRINTNHLKHIASIKLYRREKEESQQPASPRTRSPERWSEP